MTGKDNSIKVVLIIAFLAAPAIGIRILSHFSDDPYLQPLALTQEGVAAAEDGEGGNGLARIDVHVNWGREAAGTLTRERLQDMLAATLREQTRRYRIAFHDAPGPGIGVTFVVGPNSYGPHPPDKMIKGLNSALIALRMTSRPNG